jgi:hypothetical protein
MRPTLLPLLLAALALAAPAHATGGGSPPCNAQMTVAPISTIFYDPFDGVSRSSNVTIQFVNNGPDACTLAIAVASQAVGSNRYLKNGADQLRYVVEESDGDDLPNNIASPRGSYPLAGGAGKTKTVTLRVKVPSGLIAPAKTYNEMLTFRATKAGTTTQVGVDRTQNAQATVETRAQVNVAGASAWSFGSFGLDQIDFHTMTTGETRDAVVQVRATTTPITITIASQNHGKMRHKVLLSDVGVLYTLRLDGEWLDLTSTAHLVRPLAISLDGVNYPMKLKLGDVTGRPAGDYQDMLTITVAP